MCGMGERVCEVNEKVHGLLSPEVITTCIIHKIPSWFSATSVSLIKLSLYGLLFHLLILPIYKIQ